MNLVTISALAYRQAPEKALALAGQLLGDGHLGEVIIDWPAVSRLGEIPSHPLDRVHVINMHRWVRENTDGYQPDEKVIGEDARAISTDQIFLLDATGFNQPTIIGVLGMARRVWFSLEQWHSQFVLVVDDGILLPSAEALFDTFHCRPQALTIRQTRSMVRPFMRRALLARWFGLHGRRVSRFAQKLALLYERLSWQTPKK